MERARWTDERLDDRMSAIDTTFERVFDEMRGERAELRSEMRALREEMHAMRKEMHAGFTEVRGDITALQRQMTQILGAFAVTLLGVVAAGILAAA
jgi:hypothetical protein